MDPLVHIINKSPCDQRNNHSSCEIYNYSVVLFHLSSENTNVSGMKFSRVAIHVVLCRRFTVKTHTISVLIPEPEIKAKIL